VETRVGGFAMRVDDWVVTRHHLPASLQPIRAEQIGFLWFLFTLLGEIILFARYGIALRGDSDARRVTSQLGRRVGAVARGKVTADAYSGGMRFGGEANWGEAIWSEVIWSEVIRGGGELGGTNWGNNLCGVKKTFLVGWSVEMFCS
jgi:hypothetical protein